MYFGQGEVQKVSFSRCRKWTQMKDASLSGKDASFIGKAGTWIGAKFGFYCNRLSFKNDSGWMQVDWITVTE